MKKTDELTRLAFLGSLAAAMLLGGCATQQDTPQVGTAPPSVYETAEQIKAMPPCKVTVLERGPCYVFLKAMDGKGFYLGSPASKAEVERFLAVLKDGQQYDFPDTFVEYQERQRRTEP